MDINTQMFLQPNGVYDDGLLLYIAKSMFRLKWLGDYSSLTLAKPAGYLLFMSIAHVFKIPLSQFTMIYYII